MRVLLLRIIAISCLNLLCADALIASQPSHGTFELDFVEPLQPGQPNEIQARFAFYTNCSRGDLRITIPRIGTDSGITVTVWSGPIVAYKHITASVAVPGLPAGAYCFRAKCAVVECDNPTPSICEAGRSVWVTSGSAISVPRGFEPDGLTYLLNEIQEGGLSGLTLEEIRNKSPFLYKVMTLDPSVTIARPAKKNEAETLLIAPRTPPTPEIRPVKRLGTIQGVAGEPDSAWRALSKTERDSIGLSEWNRRSDSVFKFGTPVHIDLGTQRAAPAPGTSREARTPERTTPDTLAIRMWQEEARARRDSLKTPEVDPPKREKR